MGIAELTKQFAKEAISDQIKDVMGAGPVAAAPEPAADNLAATLMGQVQAMQNALKEDQELVVFCAAGAVSVRVHEMFAPSARVLVVTGIDAADKALTRIVLPADALQLICKPMPAGAGKALRIRFVTPQPAKQK